MRIYINNDEQLVRFARFVHQHYLQKELRSCEICFYPDATDVSGKRAAVIAAIQSLLEKSPGSDGKLMPERQALQLAIDSFLFEKELTLLPEALEGPKRPLDSVNLGSRLAEGGGVRATEEFLAAVKDIFQIYEEKREKVRAVESVFEELGIGTKAERSQWTAEVLKILESLASEPCRDLRENALLGIEWAVVDNGAEPKQLKREVKSLLPKWQEEFEQKKKLEDCIEKLKGTGSEAEVRSWAADLVKLTSFSSTRPDRKQFEESLVACDCAVVDKAAQHRVLKPEIHELLKQWEEEVAQKDQVMQLAEKLEGAGTDNDRRQWAKQIVELLDATSKPSRKQIEAIVELQSSLRELDEVLQAIRLIPKYGLHAGSFSEKIAQLLQYRAGEMSPKDGKNLAAASEALLKDLHVALIDEKNMRNLCKEVLEGRIDTATPVSDTVIMGQLKQLKQRLEADIAAFLERIAENQQVTLDQKYREFAEKLDDIEFTEGKLFIKLQGAEKHSDSSKELWTIDTAAVCADVSNVSHGSDDRFLRQREFLTELSSKLLKPERDRLNRLMGKEASTEADESYLAEQFSSGVEDCIHVTEKIRSQLESLDTFRRPVSKEANLTSFDWDHMNLFGSILKTATGIPGRIVAAFFILFAPLVLFGFGNLGKEVVKSLGGGAKPDVLLGLTAVCVGFALVLLAVFFAKLVSSITKAYFSSEVSRSGRCAAWGAGCVLACLALGMMSYSWSHELRSETIFSVTSDSSGRLSTENSASLFVPSQVDKPSFRPQVEKLWADIVNYTFLRVRSIEPEMIDDAFLKPFGAYVTEEENAEKVKIVVRKLEFVRQQDASKDAEKLSSYSSLALAVINSCKPINDNLDEFTIRRDGRQLLRMVVEKTQSDDDDPLWTNEFFTNRVTITVEKKTEEKTILKTWARNAREYLAIVEEGRYGAVTVFLMFENWLKANPDKDWRAFIASEAFGEVEQCDSRSAVFSSLSLLVHDMDAFLKQLQGKPWETAMLGPHNLTEREKLKERLALAEKAGLTKMAVDSLKRQYIVEDRIMPAVNQARLTVLSSQSNSHNVTLNGFTADAGSSHLNNATANHHGVADNGLKTYDVDWVWKRDRSDGMKSKAIASDFVWLACRSLVANIFAIAIVVGLTYGCVQYFSYQRIKISSHRNEAVTNISGERNNFVGKSDSEQLRSPIPNLLREASFLVAVAFLAVTPLTVCWWWFAYDRISDSTMLRWAEQVYDDGASELELRPKQWFDSVTFSLWDNGDPRCREVMEWSSKNDWPNVKTRFDPSFTVFPFLGLVGVLAGCFVWAQSIYQRQVWLQRNEVNQQAKQAILNAIKTGLDYHQKASFAALENLLSDWTKSTVAKESSDRMQDWDRYRNKQENSVYGLERQVSGLDEELEQFGEIQKQVVRCEKLAKALSEV